MIEKDHMPALDGIRGIAILLVLLVHFIPPVAMQWRVAEWFIKIFSTGGWVGVDLFFVLSGFLITGILLRTRDEPRYFINFYMRRTLRIFPLYFGALAIIFILLPHFISTPSFDAVQSYQGYFWLYLGNVAVFMAGGFKGIDNDIVSPAAYWSLAVEEHFYLIWPAVIYFCNIRTIKFVCLSLIASSFLIRCCGLMAFGQASSFFYLTPSRMDGIAAGALVATLLHEHGVEALRCRIRPIALAAAAAIAVLSIFFLVTKGLWASHWFIRTFGLSLLTGIFAATIVIAVAAPTGLLAGLLSIAPLRFFGKYSYGIYVIHAMLPTALATLFPTREWMECFGDQTLLGSVSLAAVKIAICIPIAMLSFHFYEMPFLRLKRFFGSPSPMLDRFYLTSASNDVTSPAGKATS